MQSNHFVKLLQEKYVEQPDIRVKYEIIWTLINYTAQRNSLDCLKEMHEDFLNAIIQDLSSDSKEIQANVLILLTNLSAKTPAKFQKRLYEAKIIETALEVLSILPSENNLKQLVMLLHSMIDYYRNSKIYADGCILLCKNMFSVESVYYHALSCACIPFNDKKSPEDFLLEYVKSLIEEGIVSKIMNKEFIQMCTQMEVSLVGYATFYFPNQMVEMGLVEYIDKLSRQQINDESISIILWVIESTFLELKTPFFTILNQIGLLNWVICLLASGNCKVTV